jgi:uncharacterized protein
MTETDSDRPRRESNSPHDIDPLFEAVAAEMDSWLGDDTTGHDMAHGWRVFHTAMELADASPDADREVLGTVALVHDIHRAMGSDSGEFVHPEDSLEEVEAVLDAAEFPEEKREAVHHCVALHEEYEFRGNRRDGDGIEVDLLRDADNLDAMGAVGVARCFVYSGAHDRPMWTPDSEESSAIDHFHEKLLNLRDEMHTDAARELAEQRHAFLETFLERFEAEWYGRA